MTKLDELQKLQTLRETQAISEEEFNKMKEELLRSESSFEKGGILGPSESEVSWSMYIHLTQLVSFILPLVGVILPIIFWLTKKGESKLIDAHGRIVINWFISLLIYAIISALLSLILIGYFFLFVLLVMSIAYPIIGGIKAKNGEVWRYPLSINFL